MEVFMAIIGALFIMFGVHSCTTRLNAYADQIGKCVERAQVYLETSPTATSALQKQASIRGCPTIRDYLRNVCSKDQNFNVKKKANE